MTPKDHLAAGLTRKVDVLKELSNAPYPKLESLKLMGHGARTDDEDYTLQIIDSYKQPVTFTVVLLR